MTWGIENLHKCILREVRNGRAEEMRKLAGIWAKSYPSYPSITKQSIRAMIDRCIAEINSEAAKVTPADKPLKIAQEIGGGGK